MFKGILKERSGGGAVPRQSVEKGEQWGITSLQTPAQIALQTESLHLTLFLSLPRLFMKARRKSVLCGSQIMLDVFLYVVIK